MIRALPLNVALGVGVFIGRLTYMFGGRKKMQAYANLKMAFASNKSPRELNQITRKLFINYGQNLIELLRMPLMRKDSFQELVTIEGKENIDEALKKGKG
ncbi:MAG TPA: hypothetical protein VIK48_07140, partial [Candidatus Manganitrophaceae bacterium]